MLTSTSFEVNFDGIVGPTHNYSGLAYGNIPSLSNKNRVSNPKAAAIQGLNKMFHLHQMGIKQALLPPHERPHCPTLRALGFFGTDKEVQSLAFKENQELLFACSSAASMWAANGATIIPSADTKDRRVHFIPANLTSKFHRSIESPTTAIILQRIFADEKFFRHHAALPSSSYFADEGAANHTRFCHQYGQKGLHLFVYGRHAFTGMSNSSFTFPARQTEEASRAIARKCNLDPSVVVFAQQNPMAIDAGVFHNDLISVGNQNFFFYHEFAFLDLSRILKELKEKASSEMEMIFLEVKNNRIALKDAINTYLFNSQIVTAKDGTVSLIAPSECRSLPSVHTFLEELISSSDNPISQIHYFNLHESMQNGGGPACLRIRVVLTEEELQAVKTNIFIDENSYPILLSWVEKHYRDHLVPSDLADPLLLDETQTALDELTQIVRLGPIYSFQQT